MRIEVLISLVILLSGVLFAEETVVLKDGTTVEGTIIRRDNQRIEISSSGKVHFIDLSDVLRFESEQETARRKVAHVEKMKSEGYEWIDGKWWSPAEKLTREKRLAEKFKKREVAEIEESNRQREIEDRNIAEKNRKALERKRVEATRLEEQTEREKIEKAEIANIRKALQGDVEQQNLFHDPRRALPYAANNISLHMTKKGALDALAVQFGKPSEWIIKNMGNTNNLKEIHSQLNLALLLDP